MVSEVRCQKSEEHQMYISSYKSQYHRFELGHEGFGMEKEK